jgi:histidinol-phosphate aminotransferase
MEIRSGTQDRPNWVTIPRTPLEVKGLGAHGDLFRWHICESNWEGLQPVWNLHTQSFILYVHNFYDAQEIFMRTLTREGIETLIPYPPGKPIEELERELGIKGSIKLASNENPLGPSPLAVEAIINRLCSLHRYPDGSGFYLKAALSRKFGLPADQIVLGNGSNEIIELVVRTFLSPGGHAVQAVPTFLVYGKIVSGAGGQITSVPLVDYRIDLGAIADAVRADTKIVFINNPNNPTGSALTQRALIDFLENIPRDLVVVLDEAYIEFASNSDVANGLRLLNAHPLLIVLRTFSKLYGLAGLRMGYGFASRRIVDYLDRVRQPFNANALALAAAEAALGDTGFVEKTLKLVKEGLRYLYDQLNSLGLECIPTQTNFFLIRVPLGGRTTYERMLREGVIVRAMDSYGLPEFIRINVGLPEENERFVNTLKKVLGS